MADSFTTSYSLVESLMICLILSLEQEFKPFHPNSYLLSSMERGVNYLLIKAPKYNMGEVARKGLDYLRFDPTQSYASELDERGSDYMVKDYTKGNARLVSKRVRVKKYTGNTYRFLSSGTDKVKYHRVKLKSGSIKLIPYRTMVVTPHWRTEYKAVSQIVGQYYRWKRVHLGYHKDYIGKSILRAIAVWERMNRFGPNMVKVRGR